MSKGSGGENGGKAASVEQAMEIVKYIDYGAQPYHVLQYMRENGIDYVKAYHITSVENAKSLKKNGIKLSYQDNRPAASYFFLDKDDVAKNANVLGHPNKYAVATIKIPRSEAKNMRYDGLFNASFTSSYSAARLFRSIPPGWISNIEKGGK